MKSYAIVPGWLFNAIAMPQYIAQFIEFAEIHPPVFIIINNKKFPNKAWSDFGSSIFVPFGKQRLQKCPIWDFGSDT